MSPLLSKFEYHIWHFFNDRHRQTLVWDERVVFGIDDERWNGDIRYKTIGTVAAIIVGRTFKTVNWASINVVKVPKVTHSFVIFKPDFVRI